MGNPTNSFERWVHKHNPRRFMQDRFYGACVKQQSVEVILTLRLQTVTVEEIQKAFNVSTKRAEEIRDQANKYIADIEDCLVASLE